MKYYEKNPVVVATVPHSGTHFVEKLLDLLNVEHIRIHLIPENIDRFFDKSLKHRKMVTTYRPKELSAQSLVNRIPALKKHPNGDKLAIIKTEISFLMLEKIIEYGDLAVCGVPILKETYAYYNIRPLDKLKNLCSFLGVPVSREAQAFVCLWPEVSKWPDYDRKQLNLSNPASIPSRYEKIFGITTIFSR